MNIVLNKWSDTRMHTVIEVVVTYCHRKDDKFNEPVNLYTCELGTKISENVKFYGLSRWFHGWDLMSCVSNTAIDLKTRCPGFRSHSEDSPHLFIPYSFYLLLDLCAFFVYRKKSWPLSSISLIEKFIDKSFRDCLLALL